MTVVCAWCDRWMGGDGEPVSHGICALCQAAMLDDLEPADPWAAWVDCGGEGGGA